MSVPQLRALAALPTEPAWAILEVGPGAAPEAVQQAWKRVLQLAHPDRHPDDTSLAHEVSARANVARDLLLNPRALTKYTSALRKTMRPCAVCDGQGVRTTPAKGFRAKPAQIRCTTCKGCGWVPK